MAANDYRFVTRWRLHASIKEVAEILADPLELPRWWPAVFLDARQIDPGGAGGIGSVVELFTTGWLPYTLRWRFRVVEKDAPRRFALSAMGDFAGQGVWTLSQQGPIVEVTYLWSIRAQKPLLRLGSFLLRPLFAANHRWAMKQGERSLALEVRRRRGEDVGPPPRPRRRRHVTIRS